MYGLMELDIQINLTWYLETAMESSRRASSRDSIGKFTASHHCRKFLKLTHLLQTFNECFYLQHSTTMVDSYSMDVQGVPTCLEATGASNGQGIFLLLQQQHILRSVFHRNPKLYLRHY
jgi:hypothetical protein